ncbi:DEAD/DEAH box helicase family protein [Bradyrhizobium lablabi]|uniref:DEAD/DEAH box helicase family protein n=1 Tax=Bradyrhizobium lablabi TaxID=722472 RepID=UPI00090A563D|nr:DEAD/DEAH box helicase family protein [Bradyrhizobium lablabi]SHL54975.1 hypothetical protein SAMN05444321_3268 [Bradyrhizobium lablabi]
MLTKLEHAYEKAIQQQAQSRNREITKFDREVSQSIFCAGLLAIEDNSIGVAQYRVVSAPTGSGKSSYAHAFIRAYIETFPDVSVLFLVETIEQAEATYRDISSLVGSEAVAVWTSAHDIRPSAVAVQQEQGFVPERRFSVDDLANYPVVIATHKFYMGPRSRKATVYRDQPRKLTIVDERAADVSTFDVDTGLIKTVRDRLAEKHTANLEHVAQLTILHDHLEAVWQGTSRKEAFDEIPRDKHIDLSWFNSDQANDYIASSEEQIRIVFSFGRALAKGFAFLSRYDDYGNGARFVGYEMNMPLTPGTILLDATADIDGVSLIVNNRKPVQVPQVNYRNLTITHIEPNLTKGKTVADVVKQAKHARPYAEWIIETIRQNSQPGEKVLAVAHKGLFDHEYLLDHEYLPDGHREFSTPLDLEGRQVCFVHWGTGIGSNRWKNASAVFLFGEFHLPKRAMVGTSLGLREQRATAAALAPFQSPNPRCTGLKALREGHLCRWMKQIAMRGNARNIDADGFCGQQRLFVTGEFERLIIHKDRMFPAATLTSQAKASNRARKGVKALVSFLYGTDEQEITTVDVQKLTGVSLQKNGARYLSDPIVQRAMQDTRFSFAAGKGRGNLGRFVRGLPLLA